MPVCALFSAPFSFVCEIGMLRPVEKYTRTLGNPAGTHYVFVACGELRQITSYLLGAYWHC